MSTMKTTLKNFIKGVWTNVEIDDQQEILELMTQMHTHTWEPSGQKSDEFQTSIKVVKIESRKCTKCNNIVTQETQDSHLKVYCSVDKSIQNGYLTDFTKDQLGPNFNKQDDRSFCDR